MADYTVNDELLKLCRLGIVTSKALFRKCQGRKGWLDRHGRTGYRRLGLKVRDFARACNVMQHCLRFNNVGALNDYDDQVLRYTLRTPRMLMVGMLSCELTGAMLLTWGELLSTYSSMLHVVMSAVR